MLAVGYKAPLWAVDYLLHLKLDIDVNILDVCCGTGLVARYLRDKGYVNIDALDSSEVRDAIVWVFVCLLCCKSNIDMLDVCCVTGLV